MTELPDQNHRRRFTETLDRNFSIVASAGSGKTRAITDRIVSMARHRRATEWLPNLLVVTYTNRAAAEMQQRARQSILQARVPLPVINAFNRAFFGTIHSLCLKLLRQHGHYLGLPGRLEHLDGAEAETLWGEFVQGVTTVGASLAPAERRALARLVTAPQLLSLGHECRAGNAPPPGPFPAFDFQWIYDFIGKGNSYDTVARSQLALRHWEQAWRNDEFAGNLPKCESKPLREAWQAGIEPIISWRQRASLHVASELASAYRAFRLERGRMSFDDQIELAAELLRHDEAARRIRGKGYRIVLDEAQDTDPRQFDVLLEIARPPEAEASWPNDETHPPRPGHFSMVGDFQQSIYGERADLAHYRRIHDALLSSEGGEGLTFSVTFRLDEATVRFVNSACPQILDNAGGQVAYVRLAARPDALPGQVIRWELPSLPPEAAAWNTWEKKKFESWHLAEWLTQSGLEKLRARSWREVAILCPRTRWFPALHSAIRAHGLDAQIQSERAIKGDQSAFAWFTGLLACLADPHDTYETVGVLREIFGHSDDELARFAEGDGIRFGLAAPGYRDGMIGDTMRQLAALRQRILGLPLYSALQEIVSAVRLRERLRSLPSPWSEDVDSDLDALLTLGAQAEASEMTFVEFAATVRQDFYKARDVRASGRDAIQLITVHKAKGLEWDAVILPFLAHGVTNRNQNYPVITRRPDAAERLPMFGPQDVPENLRVLIEARKQQEFERLLYVALTRARHTLILADDRVLFAQKSGLPKRAQATSLRCAAGDVNAAVFETLPTAPSRCLLTNAMHLEHLSERAREPFVPLADPPPNFDDAARERSAFFLKRNPSALAEAAPREADPSAAAPWRRRIDDAARAGKRHGTWWHGFVEHLDWTGGPRSWEKVFAAHIINAPDVPRAQLEWNLLRSALEEGGELAQILLAPGAIIHAEMPFVWLMNDNECLDGIIDLAVLNPGTGHWTILDWKTNKAGPSELDALRTHYLPQLGAYWMAACEVLQAEIVAGLYATGTGRWLKYDTEEMVDMAQRLRATPGAVREAVTEDRDQD